MNTIQVGSRVKETDGEFEGTVEEIRAGSGSAPTDSPDRAHVVGDTVAGRREGRWLPIDCLTDVTPPPPSNALVEDEPAGGPTPAIRLEPTTEADGPHAFESEGNANPNLEGDDANDAEANRNS